MEAFCISLLKVVIKDQAFGHTINFLQFEISFNSFTLTMVILLYNRKLGLFITTFNKDLQNASAIELLLMPMFFSL